MYSRQGHKLSSLRKDFSKRQSGWVELKNISPALLDLVVQVEDKNFFRHRGVDIKALGASLYQRVFKNSRRGGSTITMQMVKNIRPSKNTLLEKLEQIVLSLKMENSWSKEQILEAYLNRIFFRGEYQGIEAASYAFFAKSPQGLTRNESAMLVAMIRAPNAGAEALARRACRILPQECSALSAIANGRGLPAQLPRWNEAPHFSRWAQSQFPAYRLNSTIDEDLQKFVNESIRTQVALLKEQNVHDAAVIVLDNKTGDVLSYVGSSGEFSDSPEVDGAQALRQVGSTLKPFLYATAFEQKILTPESWIEDSPVEIAVGGGLYRPQNHDRQFNGWVRARTALASSLNVPAVKVFQLVGDQFWTKLNSLHLQELKRAELYGPALALGVADLKLWDLTNAYRSLANLGIWSPVRWDADQPPSQIQERIFSTEAAQSLQDVLSSAADRSLTFGFDSSLNTRFTTAVKTGTSKDMRDNWCLGFSKDYTVGVWVGNFSGQAMWNVLGVTGAAPLWSKVINWLHENRKNQVQEEMHLAESDSDLPAKPQAYLKPKILYPPPGLIIALDPDIPSRNQKLPLLASVVEQGPYVWFMNGKKLALVKDNPQWILQRGKHLIELRDSVGKKIEAVQIQVR